MSSNTLKHIVRLDDCWNRIGVWSPEKASCPELQQVVHCRNCSQYSAAGRRMLERPVPEDYRQEWTERFTDNAQAIETQKQSILLFRLGDEWLGLNSRFVNEITRMRTIHSLPHRGNTLVKGLVNIRGELRICVSIGRTLGLDKAREEHASDHEIHERMILVEKDQGSFVFPVSEVHGIHHYAINELKPVPATVANSKNGFSTNMLHWQNCHVGILDHELLFYALAKGLQ